MARKDSFSEYVIHGTATWEGSVKFAKTVAVKKRRKCQSELILESLRRDGYGKRERAAKFREYLKDNSTEKRFHSQWRHQYHEGVLSAASLIELKDISNSFGKSLEVAIRSGDPSELIKWLNISNKNARQGKFPGFKTPNQEQAAVRFNRVHPGRPIVVCGSCREYKDFFSCSQSGRKYFCHECAERMPKCQRCGAAHENGNTVMLNSGVFESWCESCFGRSFQWTDGHFHEGPMPLTGVGTYHSSQQYIKKVGKSIAGLCSVGFELEFAPIGFSIAKRDAISARLKKLKEIVAGVEEDGSVRPLNGAEIVTHYGSIDAIMAGAESISAVLKGNAVSHNTNLCALHVSLGRDTVDQWSLAKFVAFWNSQRNRDFLKSFCRRWESGYCKPKSEKGKITDQMSPSMIPTSFVMCNDRKELVNTQNRSRIEVRAFRGTTNAETIKRCISLCVWLMAYCCESEDRKMRYRGFLEWCKTAKRTRGEDVFTPACITEFAEFKGFFVQDSSRKIVLSKELTT